MRVSAMLRSLLTLEATALVEQVRRSYSGRVEAGEHLMVIATGDEVTIRRPVTTATR